MSTYCYFNELTLCDAPERNCAFLVDFVKLFAKLNGMIDRKCTRIVTDENAGNQIYEALQGVRDRELQNIYAALLIMPFRQFVDETGDLSARDRFNLSRYFITITPKSKPECKALGCAYENDSMSVGFPTTFFWRQFHFRISKETEDGNYERCDAFCVTDESHLRQNEFVNWIKKFQSKSQDITCLDDIRSSIKTLSHIVFCDGCWNAIKDAKIGHEWFVIWDMLETINDKLWNLQFIQESTNLQNDFNSTCSTFAYAPTESDKTKEDPDCRKARTFVYNGESIVMWPHVKYNGDYMLRVHLCFDKNMRKIAIGYIGPHLITAASKSGRVS